MKSTVILKCSCDLGPGAEYQDKTYGKGMRVHNTSKLNNTGDGLTCTVCGSKKSRPKDA